MGAMTKFFDKKLADELGTGAAVAISALAADLRSKMGTFDAIRKAKGMPTLQEEMDEAIDYVRQMVARGEARREDYPEIFEDDLPGAEGE